MEITGKVALRIFEGNGQNTCVLFTVKKVWGTRKLFQLISVLLYWRPTDDEPEYLVAIDFF